MKSMSIRVPLLVVALLCQMAGLATAQQPSQSQVNAIKQSCRSDYQSHCASVPTGGNAALQCLRENAASLSAPCQTAVNAAGGSAAGGSGASQPPAAAMQSRPPAAALPPMTPRQEVALIHRSCGADFHAYCQGVPLGGGRGIACLADNASRLSRPCQGALAEARASR
jgi:Cysteine rich repeat